MSILRKKNRGNKMTKLEREFKKVLAETKTSDGDTVGLIIAARKANERLTKSEKVKHDKR